MTLTAILLIITSACAHVAWNFVGKKHHPNLPFFAIALVFGNILLTPMVVWHASLFTIIPPQVWGCLLLTSCFQALYMSGLVGAYQNGHLSVAYPLARAIPVLLVAIIRVLWSGAPLHAGLYMGGVLIVIGVLLLPLPTFSAWHWQHYRNRSCFFALIAAIGTTGYSIIDDHALHLYRAAPGSGSNPVPLTITYAFLESTFTFLWLLPWILTHKIRRLEAKVILLRHWKAMLVTSGGMILGYLLILISLAYVDDVAYVVAFRQLSIPLGALVGIVLLGEPAHRPKVVGVGLMFLGLVWVALG